MVHENISEITETGLQKSEIRVESRLLDNIRFDMPDSDKDKNKARLMLKIAFELLFQLSLEDIGTLVEEASQSNGRDMSDLLLIIGKFCNQRSTKSPGSDEARWEAAGWLIVKAGEILKDLGKEDDD